MCMLYCSWNLSICTPIIHLLQISKTCIRTHIYSKLNKFLVNLRLYTQVKKWKRKQNQVFFLCRYGSQQYAQNVPRSTREQTFLRITKKNLVDFPFKIRLQWSQNTCEQSGFWKLNSKEFQFSKSRRFIYAFWVECIW